MYSEEDRRPQLQSHDLSDRAQVCALGFSFFSSSLSGTRE